MLGEFKWRVKHKRSEVQLKGDLKITLDIEKSHKELIFIRTGLNNWVIFV